MINFNPDASGFLDAISMYVMNSNELVDKLYNAYTLFRSWGEGPIEALSHAETDVGANVEIDLLPEDRSSLMKLINNYEDEE